MRSRSPTISTLFIAACVVTPAVASAGQAGIPGPRVEIGVDAAALGVDSLGALGTWGPRATINFTPRLAVDLYGDSRSEKRPYGLGWRDIFTVGVQVKRALYQSGDFSVSGTVGAGVQQVRRFTPAIDFGTGLGRTVFPATLKVTSSPAVTLGTAVERRVGAHLSVRAQMQFVVSEISPEMRATVGVAVPIGAYRNVRGGQPSLRLGGTTLRPGQHVWLTLGGGGEVLEGAIGRIDNDAFDVITPSRTTRVTISDVTRVEVPDSLKNGTLTGVAVGAASGGALLGFLGWALSEGDNDEVGLIAIAGAGYGAAIGALVGAMADSLHEGRRTVFDRAPTGTRLSIAPIVHRRGAAVLAHMSWK
jgi:hypothetical protein